MNLIRYDIDDVNATLESRNEWILLAQKHHIQIRAFSFTSPSDLCLHNDSVRALGGPLVSSPIYIVLLISIY